MKAGAFHRSFNFCDTFPYLTSPHPSCATVSIDTSLETVCLFETRACHLPRRGRRGKLTFVKKAALFSQKRRQTKGSLREGAPPTRRGAPMCAPVNRFWCAPAVTVRGSLLSGEHAGSPLRFCPQFSTKATVATCRPQRGRCRGTRRMRRSKV